MVIDLQRLAQFFPQVVHDALRHLRVKAHVFAIAQRESQARRIAHAQVHSATLTDFGQRVTGLCQRAACCQNGDGQCQQMFFHGFSLGGRGKSRTPGQRPTGTSLSKFAVRAADGSKLHQHSGMCAIVIRYDAHRSPRRPGLTLNLVHFFTHRPRPSVLPVPAKNATVPGSPA